ncbi:MAG: hypothetical protein AW07_04109 [Candidatus Accumulibacter sp. SK-11]|nr:MAG: hypothetical protein AW07_04109 [Candidatus Accumulibacter sp. SK-11]
MRGQMLSRWRLLAMSPASTCKVPCCSLRAPEISASRLDLPTPSGPMMPTMQLAGIASVMPSSATVLP